MNQSQAMIKFLQAAFRISFFQLILLGIFAALKYTLNNTGLTAKITEPFFWVYLGAGVIFMAAASIRALKENKEGNEAAETNNQPKTLTQKALAGFAQWGMAIPATLALALFIYMITPTSVWSAIALYAGIVIGNVIRYFSNKSEQHAEPV